nr:hypothetical protein [Bacteroidota bacterium]
MKKLALTFVFLISALLIFAQPPQAFNYQAIARNTDGNALPGQIITLKITIQEYPEYPPQTVYVETQSTFTDPMGLFSIAVGTGVVQFGVFQDIDWGIGNYLLHLMIDPEGGTNFQYFAAMQLQSVPYALYAESSGMDNDWITNGDNLSSAVIGNVGIGTETPQAKLSVFGGVRASNDETESDYLEMKHGASNAYLNWGGASNLDFRFDGNTLMRVFPDGRIALGADYAASSALLQLNSTTKGFRPPTMNASKVAA